MTMRPRLPKRRSSSWSARCRRLAWSNVDIHQVTSWPRSSRVVALSPEKLKHIPCVMIASGGRTKVPGLRGVLKGGMCDVIITDEQTAQSILAMEMK